MSEYFSQRAFLIGIRPLDFVSKDTGEEVRGTKLVLCRPAKDPKFDGFGFVVFDLNVMGRQGLAMAPDFVKQSHGLYLRPVVVNCDVEMTGKHSRFVPNHILPVDPVTLAPVDESHHS